MLTYIFYCFSEVEVIQPRKASTIKFSDSSDFKTVDPEENSDKK